MLSSFRAALKNGAMEGNRVILPNECSDHPRDKKPIIQKNDRGHIIAPFFKAAQ
ncbi:MAG: hypothetical protein KDD99_25725 [Bacteroidetes bacterium]|nr:hypothetical protein [Bacteroidota bacterium]